MKFYSLALLLSAVPAFAQYRYEIDPVHSSAQFSVKHMMVTNVRGEFNKVSGTISFDPANPAADHVEATIDATTVSTHDAQRDEHLRSPEFFDVAKFPTLTFKSTKVEKKDGKYLVTGDLTMHGVTKPAVLSVEGPTAEVKDSRGSYHAGVSATTKVDRKDFGLVWNKALDGGGVMVGDEVNITLDIEMVRKPGEQPATAKTN